MNTVNKISVLVDTLTEYLEENVSSHEMSVFFRTFCNAIEQLQPFAYLSDSDVFTNSENYSDFIRSSIYVALISPMIIASNADGEIDRSELEVFIEMINSALDSITNVDSSYLRFYPLEEEDLSDFLEHSTNADLIRISMNTNLQISHNFCFITAIKTGSLDFVDQYMRIFDLAFKMVIEADGEISYEESIAYKDFKNGMKSIRKLAKTFSSDEMRTSFLEVARNNTTQNSLKISETGFKSGTNIATESLSIDRALQESNDELNTLIGLTDVKREVKRLSNFLQIETKRKEAGLPSASQSIHFVFTGNPGTGKTTVARIMAKLLYGFGVLKSFKLIETDRSTLVGGYIGQTAIKTKEVLDSALNGVLFIDEAYTLSGKGQSDFGQEAIDTILKSMEDNRSSLVVIAAGYTIEMEQFLSSNPGLKSRFTRFIDFPDYNVKDLSKIFLELASKNQYILDQSALGNLSIIFHKLYRNRDGNFGNGRLVRNIFEKTLGNHSDRIVHLENFSKEILTTITSDDLPYDIAGLKAAFNLDLCKWHAKCAGCEKTSKVGINFLGKRVKCKCGHGFIVPFWNIIPNTFELSSIVIESLGEEALFFD